MGEKTPVPVASDGLIKLPDELKLVAQRLQIPVSHDNTVNIIL